MNTELIEAEATGVETEALTFAEFDSIAAGLAKLKALTSLTIAKDGIGKVTEARRVVTKTRTGIEEVRKKLKASSLEYGRKVDSTAKALTAEVSAVEQVLKAQEEEHEAAKERARQAKEAEKAAALQIRVDQLRAAGVDDINLVPLGSMNGEEFEAHFNESVRLADERRAAEATRRAEQEAQEAREREERERLEAERLAEFARQAEEIRIREAELAAEQRRMDAERAALRAEQEAARREQERLAEIERENKRAIERELREQAAAKEAARVAEAAEALKPEIEKAKAFAEALLTDAKDTLTRLGDPPWREMAEAMVIECGGDIVRRVETMNDLPF